ncbi:MULTISPECIES: M20/M25/M40 family metallo-hydrolase [unclassified Arcicella]|uniref:M28 family metallopeptidase n=1 Tax=unclassified Arcicella TaxID=2644986 RepID=UPI002861A084|nr:MULTISPECIES: M20/M25/M40 family metallo-hydrolase [unclassified Arcicella]MDR6563015.1 hypothetical protein [Arcicella sp. BE51]MDR6813099.1 hypothetical protein [Arcicella sp. BE140]MDR6824413.1 hypothetical protein [Arcicella sp. BE139]
MRKIFTVIFASFITFHGFSQAGIKENEVARIIKTLSADDMMGRRTFTPGIEKASLFLQNEFKRIGLKPLTGLTSFEQKFNMYSLKPQQAAVTLNNTTIENDKYFFVTAKESLSWTDPSKVSVFYVNENDNLRKAYGEIKKKNLDAIVLVNPKHQKMFANYKRYLGSGSMSESVGKGESQLFVLADSSQLSSIKVALKNSIETLPLANVAGMIPGKRANEYLVFSGHYDHLGYQKAVEGDSIANGADDDASGTTAVVTLADYYKKLGKPERTLIFVCFTAEEIGGYGSQYFSKQLNPDEIVAMFNIEMIGKPSKFGANSAFITGFERSDFGTFLQEAVKGTNYSFHPDPYTEQNLFYRSDNATLARLGVPAHSISSDQIDIDKLYHSVNDEFESLDMPHMTNMIKAIAVGSKPMVDGKVTPKRVNKAEVD